MIKIIFLTVIAITMAVIGIILEIKGNKNMKHD